MDYIKNNSIHSDAGMYLTDDSLIEINNIITGSNNIILRNVTPYGFDEMYMDKEWIEDKLYQIMNWFNERKIASTKFYSILFNKIRSLYDGHGRIYLFVYLFIFNLFIVEIFISVTTRIALHKQQGLSQTPGAVNNIPECWYRWYQTFETKYPFAVLIKVNPKQKRKKKPMQPTDNWHYIIMN